MAREISLSAKRRVMDDIKSKLTLPSNHVSTIWHQVGEDIIVFFRYTRLNGCKIRAGSFTECVLVIIS
jgi:hypothetical protein